MDHDDIQSRRSANQRRILFELIQAIPALQNLGKNFPRNLNQYFRDRSQFGSRDRRLYRELIYTYLRYQPWLEALADSANEFMDTLISLATSTPDIAKLCSTTDPSSPFESSETARHRIIGRSDNELSSLIPSWFSRHLFRELDIDDLLALFSRPPLWIRVQKGDRESIATHLSAGLPQSAQRPVVHETVPDAIHCPPDFPVQNFDDYKRGNIEIQDISSQILLHLIDPKPTGDWVDTCAGAGGKSLQLAQLLGSKGRVFAYDTRPRALDELIQRSKRAGFHNISVVRQLPTGKRFNGVLVDAPCSGSGTWRRHPYLMRQTNEKEIMDAAEKQFALLSQYAAFVKPNGQLVYCTCSLSRFENQEVARRFLENHSEFQHNRMASKFGLSENGHGVTVFPKDFNGDGLYVASFKRSSSPGAYPRKNK
tara:strand:+ start:5165 stop:6439 length:1275 start_codon:yes stop_codon:yes gene_type:complete